MLSFTAAEQMIFETPTLQIPFQNAFQQKLLNWGPRNGSQRIPEALDWYLCLLAHFQHLVEVAR